MDYKNFDLTLNLDGKVALVTGAGSGIGLEICRTFAKRKAKIIAFDLENSDQLLEYFTETGTEHLSVKGDITSEEDIANLVESGIAKFSKIDVLVNCAGVGLLEAALENKKSTWDLTLAINLSGMVNLSIAVAKHMISRSEGSIINIASQAGVVAIENHLAYGVSKAGIIQATKQFALEWGKYGVRTNAVSPTIILTPMGEMNWNNEKGIKAKEAIPLKRFGYPEEVAACVLFLASDASRLFNGANLLIDGGYTIV